MKKILAIALLTLVATTASAQYHHQQQYQQHRHHHRPGHSIVPFVLGAVVGGVIIESQRQSVIVQPTVIADPNIAYIDGQIYRKEVMFINGSYQEVLVRVYRRDDFYRN
jgi:hypothetical protein